MTALSFRPASPSLESLEPRLLLDAAPHWSGYLGGEMLDIATAVAADPSGNVLVAGFGSSAGWVSGGYDTELSDGDDGFLAKFTPGGELLWSTYIGGDGDDSCSAVAADSAGNIYVAGVTSTTDFASGGADTTLDGPEDIFLMKLSPAGTPLWSTFVGGSGSELLPSLAIDGDDHVVVAGSTTSVGLASGGYDTIAGGWFDGFVARFGPGGAPLWSTYLGGSLDDWANGVTADSAGRVWVTGLTYSDGWVSGGFDTTLEGSSDAFVVALTAEGGHRWSTCLGGTLPDVGSDVTIDAAGNVAVIGRTQSAGWLSGGFDTQLDGDQNAFVASLTPEGGFRWGACLGNNWERGQAIDTDASGNLVAVGETTSPGWIAGGFITEPIGGIDGFVATLTPDGEHLWSSYFGGFDLDWAYDAALSPSGDILVAGGTTSPGWTEGGADTTWGGSFDGYVLAISTALKGDFDGNGAVNGLDIPDFKSALTDPGSWAAAHPGLPHPNLLGDFDGNGVFNGLDIPGFKAALGGAVAATSVAIPDASVETGADSAETAWMFTKTTKSSPAAANTHDARLVEALAWMELNRLRRESLRSGTMHKAQVDLLMFAPPQPESPQDGCPVSLVRQSQ